MTAVEGGLAEGVQLQRWQVDSYSDEPYCANFRGEPKPQSPPTSSPEGRRLG